MGNLNAIGEVILSSDAKLTCQKIEAMYQLGVISKEKALEVLERFMGFGHAMTAAATSTPKDVENFALAYRCREDMVKELEKAFRKMDAKCLDTILAKPTPSELLPLIADSKVKAEENQRRQREEALEALKKMMGGGIPGIEGFSPHDCEHCPPDVRSGCNLPDKLAWEAKQGKPAEVAP